MGTHLKRLGHRTAEHFRDRITDVAEEQHDTEQIDDASRDLQQSDDSVLAKAPAARAERGEGEEQGAWRTSVLVSFD